jgi:hypothetical protein
VEACLLTGGAWAEGIGQVICRGPDFVWAAVDAGGQVIGLGTNLSSDQTWVGPLGEDGTFSKTPIGSGDRWPGRDPIARDEARTYPLRVLVSSPSGSLFLGAPISVYRLDADGEISLLAGQDSPSAPWSTDPADPIGKMLQVTHMALGPDGTLYILSSVDAQLRAVTPQGRLLVVAGSGARGSSGDGGPAVSAQFSPGLSAVAVDRAGNLYLSDSKNNRVRKVDRQGLVSTVAGIGPDGYYDPEAHMWYMVAPNPQFAGDGGPAREAQLFDPESLAVDAAGSLYIADVGNGRVRKVDRWGRISTVLSGFHGVFFLAIDDRGDLLVSQLTHDFGGPAGYGDWILTRYSGLAAPGLIGGQLFASTASLPLGDVDANGHTSVADALGALRMVVGMGEFTEAERWRTDVTGEGRVTVADVIGILHAVLGLSAATTLGSAPLAPQG